MKNFWIKGLFWMGLLFFLVLKMEFFNGNFLNGLIIFFRYKG